MFNHMSHMTMFLLIYTYVVMFLYDMSEKWEYTKIGAKLLEN